MSILFLRSLNIKQHAIQLEDTFLQRAGLISNLTRLRRGISSWFTLNHDVKVDEFLGEGRHVVFKAEGIFSDGVGC